MPGGWKAEKAVLSQENKVIMPQETEMWNQETRKTEGAFPYSICVVSLHLTTHLTWPTQEKFLTMCPSARMSTSVLTLLPRWHWW